MSKLSFTEKTDNWGFLKKRAPKDTAKYRDVYGDQQLERSRIEQKETMTSRIIAAAILSVLAFVVVWCAMSFFQYLAASAANTVPYVYVTDDGKRGTFVPGPGPGAQPGDGSQSGTDGTGSDASQGPADTRPLLYYDLEGNFVTDDREAAAGLEALYDRNGNRVDIDGQVLNGDGDVVAPAGTTFNENGVPIGSDGHVVSNVTSYSDAAYVAWRDAHYTFQRPGKGIIADWYTDNATGEVVGEGTVKAIYIDAWSAGRVEEFLLKDYKSSGGQASGSGSGAQAGQAGDQGGSGTGAGGTGTGADGGAWLSDYPGPYYDAQGNLIGDTAPDDGSALYDADGRLVRQATLVPDEGAAAGQEGQGEGDGQAGMFEVPGIGLVPKSNISRVTWTYYILKLTFLKIVLSFGVAFALYGLLYTVFRKNLDAQNLLKDPAMINQWPNDQHIQLPEEIQEAYDWFPDAGAHAPVQVSSMISHMMLSKKGLKSVPVLRRADKDIMTKSGELAYFKGEPLLDADGEPIFDVMPIIDEKFGTALFDASGLPDDKELRTKYVAGDIKYNPGDQNRDKVKGAATVAELINKYWEFPEYEPQRPAGAYIVDTQPVNTISMAHGVINA